jgi:uncharacterized protein YwqG
MNALHLPLTLELIRSEIEALVLPCAAFSLKNNTSSHLPVGASKLGGNPDLPDGFQWPEFRGKPLHFVLQVNLKDIAEMPKLKGLLPQTGLLSFFYDLEEQPWGYDPAEIDGFHVCYFKSEVELSRCMTKRPDSALAEFELEFREELSLPGLGHRAANALANPTDWTDDMYDAYSVLVADLGSQTPGRSGGKHRLLGHSENIQGDMQLEAQLVTNGLYCGNASGYEDPRRASLEERADDWILLLQLDSDDVGNFMWGDSGMLYFWIRKQDLIELRFDRVWMTLQCC